LQLGEDPDFIARRLVRMATEDIALQILKRSRSRLAHGKRNEQLGSPEGDLALAQAVIYLALCPKSNAVYTAFKEAQNSHLLLQASPLQKPF